VTFKNINGKPVLLQMVAAIQKNKAYLSELDGLIGDGDHGVNMAKGFTSFGERIKDKDISFTEGLEELGNVLLKEIGDPWAQFTAYYLKT
jgi:dihydroxyacetone kinase-like protein